MLEVFDAAQQRPAKSEIAESRFEEGAMNHEVEKGPSSASIIAALAVIGVIGALYAPLIIG
jgi:hypothetical protein